MKTRNFSVELARYRSKHTFDKNCIKCKGKGYKGKGYKGKIKEGKQRGAFIACDCAKNKMIKTTNGNIPITK